MARLDESAVVPRRRPPGLVEHFTQEQAPRVDEGVQGQLGQLAPSGLASEVEPGQGGLKQVR